MTRSLAPTSHSIETSWRMRKRSEYTCKRRSLHSSKNRKPKATPTSQLTNRKTRIGGEKDVAGHSMSVRDGANPDGVLALKNKPYGPRMKTPHYDAWSTELFHLMSKISSKNHRLVHKNCFQRAGCLTKFDYKAIFISIPLLINLYGSEERPVHGPGMANTTHHYY